MAISIHSISGRHIFLRLLLPYILGILFEEYWGVSEKLYVVFLVGLLILVFLLNLSIFYSFRLFFVPSVVAFLFVSGAWMWQMKKVEPMYVEAGEDVYAIEITDDFTATTTAYKTTGLLYGTRDSAYARLVKLQLYFNTDSQPNLFPGSVILARCSLQRIRNAGNPGEFDKVRYMALRGIFQSVFLKDGSFMYSHSNESFNIVYEAKKWRRYLLQNYKRMGLSKQEFAVASALTLGYKNALDPGTKSAFSSSGAMHILAVSGLHVGIVYLVFLRILSLFPFLFFRRWLRPFLLIGILWVFALLTGLSPSVMRSAIMFSIFILGEVFLSTSNFFNKLAATAFLLLFWRPAFLFDVGFQLSFSAVAAIVYFQGYVDNELKLPDWLPKFLIDSFSVSFIAQMGTLGLTLYYFHQFPNYFYITNLFAVPLAFILVVLALLAIPFSFIPPEILGDFAGIFKFFLQQLIAGVETVEALPNSTWVAISISPFQLIMFYVLLAMIGLWLQYKKQGFVYAMLGAFLFFVANSVWQDITRSRTSEIVVFNVNKKTLIAMNKEGRVVFWTDEDETSYGKLDYFTHSYLVSRYTPLKHAEYRNVDDGFGYHGFAEFGRKRIFLLRDNSILKRSAATPIDVDWLIISNNVKVEIGELKHLFNFDSLIIDGSNNRFRSKYIEKECKEQSVPYHSVRESGALVVPL